MLPAGAQRPTWNGVLFEPHYVYSPQLIFIGRYETIKMSQQANGRFAERTSPSNLGNIHLHRWLSLQPVHDQPGRFCLAQRVQLVAPGRHSRRLAPNINTSELMFGFDFDF